MEERAFGKLGTVSALALGGGGIGQVWGKTTREEGVATLREAIEGGITFLDMAPSYGDGEAENVVGAAYGGQLPEGVMVSTKCVLGNPPAADVASILGASLTASLARMQLDHVDVFLLHGQIYPDAKAGQPGYRGTPLTLFREAVRPALEGLVSAGLARAWGISAIGEPGAVIEAIGDSPAPEVAQVVVNLLDSVGGMHTFEGPARPREILAAATRSGAAVMGIRAVQAGALTSAMDRPLRAGNRDAADFERAAPFRALAASLGESPAALAHRYALSMPGVATVVLGVKNREELRECLAAEARGPLDAELMARIDASAGRA